MGKQKPPKPPAQTVAAVEPPQNPNANEEAKAAAGAASTASKRRSLGAQGEGFGRTKGALAPAPTNTPKLSAGADPNLKSTLGA